MTSSSDPSVGTCTTSMVTQMYTFSSWSKQNGYNHSGMMPYVGFPGLSLTPIPESPLLNSVLNEDSADLNERDRWLPNDLPLEDPRHSHKPPKNGSLPRQWLGRGRKECPSIEENGEVVVEAGGGGKGGANSNPSPTTCSVNVQVVQTTTFLPKDAPMTPEEKRAHVCKLLLFALCGFVIVAGIVLWIFSPAFT
ncbi:hypothetical protein ACOMHN_008150 [Nucella lapillus]